MKIKRNNTQSGDSKEKNPRLNEMTGILNRCRHENHLSTPILKERLYYEKPSIIKQKRIKKKKLMLKNKRRSNKF